MRFSIPWQRSPNGAATPAAVAPTAESDQRRQDRGATDERRRQERADREAMRQQVAARRRQVAGELATAALAWGLNAWLEGAMWFCLFGGLVVLYIGSYADLAATFGAFGYDAHISWLMPLGIDLPVTASVLAGMLAGRWKSGWWVRVRLGLLTAVMAPLTLIGNALRGVIDSTGHFASTFHVQLWMDLLAFAVPGLGVVLIGYVASMMQGERAELTRRRLEAEVDAASGAFGGEREMPSAHGQASRALTVSARPTKRASRRSRKSTRAPLIDTIPVSTQPETLSALIPEPVSADVSAAQPERPVDAMSAQVVAQWEEVARNDERSEERRSPSEAASAHPDERAQQAIAVVRERWAERRAPTGADVGDRLGLSPQSGRRYLADALKALKASGERPPRTLERSPKKAAAAVAENA